MFNAYEFSFAGISSSMYGLMLYDIDGHSQSDVAFGNKAEVVESRIINRVQPIHFGVNYHSSPLEFNIVFGAEQEMDRYDMERVAMWLTGYQDYQWLTIDQPDMMKYQYRCIISELTPISHGWLPVAFEATVLCDCPYAYGYPFDFTYEINTEDTIVVKNESSVREYIKPQLIIEPRNLATGISIVNHDDNGREFAIVNIPFGTERIVIDNINGIITDSTGVNLYDGFNMNYFRLVPGDNNLHIIGDCKITFSGRFLYNIAA